MTIDRPRIAGAIATHQPSTMMVVPEVTKTQPPGPKTVPIYDEDIGATVATQVDIVPEDVGQMITFVDNQGRNNRFAEIWVGIEINGVLQYVQTDLGAVESRSGGSNSGQITTA